MGLFLSKEEKRRIEGFKALESYSKSQENEIERLETRLYDKSDELANFKSFYRELPTKLNVNSIYDYEQKEYVKNRFKDKYPDADFDKANARLMDYFIAVGEHSDIEMSDTIADEIWHLMLLDTVEYRNFCYTFFGEMIEHIPYAGNKPLTEKEVIEISRKIAKSVKKREPSRYSSMRDSYDDNTGIMLLAFMATTIDDINTTAAVQSTSSFYDSSSSSDTSDSSSSDSSYSSSSSYSSCSSSSSSSCSSSSSSCGSSCGSSC